MDEERDARAAAEILSLFAERCRANGDMDMAMGMEGIGKLLEAAPSAASREEQNAILRLIEIALKADPSFKIG